MKILDHNGRLFGKISIVDVVVLLVVAVLAVALNHKAQLPETGNTVDNVPISFSILVRNQEPGIVDSIHPGDGLYDPDRSTGGSLGSVTGVEVLDGTYEAKLADGRIAMVPCDERVDLLISFEGSGMVDNGRYLLNRIYELGVNASRTMNTKYASFTATVVDIHG